MSEDILDGRADAAAAVLAQKLNLLIDVMAVEGRAPTFRDVSDALARVDVPLSRARWSYMTAGTGTAVKDRRLLSALSDYFEVDSKFLLSASNVNPLSSDLPARIEAQLELVRAMRVARVKNFATRALGDVSPDTLRAITRFLDSHEAAQT